MIWCQPLVEDLGHLDHAAAQREAPRRFLAAVSGVAFDQDAYMSFMHDSALARSDAPPFAAPHLLCDEMLQGLGRWLRAAGYDTEIATASRPDSVLLAASARTGRVLLTCDRPLAARAAGRGPVLALPAGGLDAQAAALRETLGIDWLLAPFSRCLRDNAVLAPAAAEERDRVPPKARALGGPVTACPDCGRLYWHGSHVQRMAVRLRSWRGAGAAVARA